MSGWFKSMGSILEKLDDGVGTVVIETDQARAALAQRLFAGRRTRAESSDEDDYETEEYEDQDDTESYENDEDEEEGIGEEGGDAESYDEVVFERENVHSSGDFMEGQQEGNNGKGLVDIDGFDSTNQRSDARVTNDNGSKAQILTTMTSSLDSPTIGNEDDKKSVVAPLLPVDSSDNSSFPKPAINTTPSTAEDLPAVSSDAGSNEHSVQDRLSPMASVPDSIETLLTTKDTTPTSLTGTNNPKSRLKTPLFTSPPPPPPPAIDSGNNNRLTKAQQQISSLQQQQRRLEKHNLQLQAQLEATQSELLAQHKELELAAVELHRLRQQHQEEQDELTDEQEEEIQSVRDDYDRKLKKQREQYESQLLELKMKLELEQANRAQEEGTFTEELERVVARERNALQQCHDLRSEKIALEQRVKDLITDRSTQQQRIEMLDVAAKTATKREREAEERLDAAIDQHKQILSQRHAREAELEKTVAELGTALAQKTHNPSHEVTGGDESSIYMEKFQVASEELETLRTQLTLSNERCEAVISELADVSYERNKEAALYQQRQRESDEKISELIAQIALIEASMRDRNRDQNGKENLAAENETELRWRKALRDAHDANASITDELVRQQGLTESSKAEILALKGRLQAALARADAAEQQALATDNRLIEMEGGSTSWSASKIRRRVKSGRHNLRTPHSSSRTARTALGLRFTHSSAMEQIALTLDTIDGFMTDAVEFLRKEPLARVGAALYLTIVHLWCMGLVFFHAVESEHADLGTLTNRGGMHHN